MAITPDVAGFVFGPWTTEDTVTGPARVPYLDDGEPADLTPATIGAGRLTDPAGLSGNATAELDATNPAVIKYTLDAGAFQLAGVWQLSAQLEAAGNLFRTVPAQFVVEDAGAGWATIADARAGWRDAPANDAQLWRLLDVARRQVIEWAPAREAGTRPPSNEVTAQLTQARNVWNAVKSDPANQGIGDEGFVIRPFPMDWTVKNMIRPPSAKPVVR